MIFEFELALNYLDSEQYDKAIQYMGIAIDKSLEKGNEIEATEYRCVLGELYTNLGREDEAREQFGLVLQFCDEHNVLPKQRHIAKTFLNAFDGILPEIPEEKQVERPGYIPLVPKPVQDKGFINRQMKKKHR